MKRLFILLFMLTLIPFSFKITKASAKEVQESSSESEITLEGEIDNLITKLDLLELENFLKELPKEIIGTSTIKEQLTKMIKGEISASYNSVAEYLSIIFFNGIKQKLPTFITIFSLLLICAIIKSIKPERLGNGVYEITFFACYSIIVTIIITIVYTLVVQSKQTIEKTSKIVQSVFPIMLALMTVTGNTSSVAVYNPSMLFITDFVVIVINKVVFPVILGMLAISVVSNICKGVKLNGLLQFSSSSLKWIIGLVATVFSLFLTVRGLNAGIHDGISMRAIKYTVNSSVPLVGGLLRDGLDLILASGILVKNALGGLAIIIIFGTIIQPIVEIVCVVLALRLVNAVLQPLNDERVVSFINSVCSVINFAIASMIIVSLMYVVIIIMSICSSQMIF
ncbi:MAG: stage III sporulation protein AE [Clostridia bacterium]|nr:stage III sporulation protein AE [Clostridia bacterium]